MNLTNEEVIQLIDDLKEEQKKPRFDREFDLKSDEIDYILGCINFYQKSEFNTNSQRWENHYTDRMKVKKFL